MRKRKSSNRHKVPAKIRPTRNKMFRDERGKANAGEVFRDRAKTVRGGGGRSMVMRDRVEVAEG